MKTQLDQINFAEIFGVRKRRSFSYSASDLVRFRKDGGTGEASTSRISGLANLLVEASGGTVTRQGALSWLLDTREGRAMIASIKQQKEGAMPHDRMTELRDMVSKASGGFEQFAKVLADNPSSAAKISEAEYTALATEAACKVNPRDKPDVAFGRYFSDPANTTIRKAHAVVKAAPFTKPLGDEPAHHRESGDTSGSAYDELVAKAAELRKANPALTVEQSFAKVYSDPANSELSQRERLQSRPTAGW